MLVLGMITPIKNGVMGPYLQLMPTLQDSPKHDPGSCWRILFDTQKWWNILYYFLLVVIRFFLSKSTNQIND